MVRCVVGSTSGGRTEGGTDSIGTGRHRGVETGLGGPFRIGSGVQTPLRVTVAYPRGNFPSCLSDSVVASGEVVDGDRGFRGCGLHKSNRFLL